MEDWPAEMAVMKAGEAVCSKLPRAAAVVVSLSLAATVAAPACQIVEGYGTFTGHPCNPLPASKLDKTGLATLVLSKEPGTCYWIDKTETTVQQYAAFLDDLAMHPRPLFGESDGGAPDPCAWKAVPRDPRNDATCLAMTTSESGAFDANKPIRCVDWCDAKAFCEWAGGSLCEGNTADATITPLSPIDQWGDGCSTNGFSYVTGSMPVYGACNVGINAGQCLSLTGNLNCAPSVVGNFPECTGPSGTVDMIGNVAEWVLQCGSHDGGPDTTPCQVRGGSFAGNLTDETCAKATYPARSTHDHGIGLRCCADLTQDEKNHMR
jgi:formylglycine-generating enzyme required for sulfatase activity